MRKLIIAAASITALAVPAISQASAYVTHHRVTSLTTGTTYNCTACVDTDTRPRADNHSSTDVASTVVTTHHLNNNDAEWGPDSPSGLHSHCDG